MPTPRAGLTYIAENAAANADPVNDALDEVDAAFVLTSELTAHEGDADVHHAEVHAIDGGDHTGSISSSQHGTIASGNLHPEYATDTDLTNHGALPNAHHTQAHDVNGSDHTGTPVTLAKGGTSKALTASAGGIVYTDADSMEVLAGTGTAGKVLRSGANAAPSWSGSTYPSSAGSVGRVPRSDGTNYVDAQLGHGDLSSAGSNSHATIDSHLAATAAHGATGAVVGTTNSQTLSGKTLTAPQVNGLSVSRLDKVNTGYSLLATDDLLTVSTGASERQIVLPDLGSVPEGKSYKIFKRDAGAGDVKITTVGGDPIICTGGTGIVIVRLQSVGAAVEVMAGTSTWFVMSAVGTVAYS